MAKWPYLVMHLIKPNHGIWVKPYVMSIKKQLMNEPYNVKQKRDNT